jgi:glycosyltransferase involved in cell wall biosynthesis
MAAAVVNGSGPDCPEARSDGISVVIPALNEAANIPHVLQRLPDFVCEVVLVDGGSSDGTVEVARSARPDIRVVRQTGRGKGNALTCGFEVCTGEIIVMIDADGSTDPSEIPRFVDALKQGADMAKGSRFTQGGGSADITHLRRAGNRVLCGLVNVLYRTRYSDLCYGFNAFWKASLRQLRIDCDGFEIETLINIRTAKARLRVVEVPSFELGRMHGESNLRPVRDGWRVLRTIVRERFSPARFDARGLEISDLIVQVSDSPN